MAWQWDKVSTPVEGLEHNCHIKRRFAHEVSLLGYEYDIALWSRYRLGLPVLSHV